jgi:hypothetical protein
MGLEALGATSRFVEALPSAWKRVEAGETTTTFFSVASLDVVAGADGGRSWNTGKWTFKM